MKKVYNIPRKRAEFCSEYFSPEKYAWISIQEPGNEPTTNENLDRLNKLKLEFWDIDFPGLFYNEQSQKWEQLDPVSDELIEKIYNFLIENRNKNIISNCRMGISRSGAISNFCCDCLGHEWDTESHNRALPNKYLYRKLYNLYEKDNDITKLTIIDKRKREG